MKKLLIVFCALAFGVISFVQVGQAANLITNPSFETLDAAGDPEETTETTHVLPPGSGDWGGDWSYIVTTQDSIVPIDEIRMLQFEGTTQNASCGGKYDSGQVYQIVDVPSSYWNAIDLGNATLDASAFFNRVYVDVETDKQFTITIFAFDATTVINYWDYTTKHIGSSGGNVITDNDLETWEIAEITAWGIPATTRKLLVRLTAYEIPPDGYNDYAYPEFDGHYADMVSLEISVDSSPQTVDIDIKFCSNPNAFNCKSKGKTPVTIFGTEDLDVTELDISTLRLCIYGTCVESAPLSWSFADRGDPATDLGAEECAIVDEVEQDYLNPDGYLDLDVAFDSRQIAALIICHDLLKNDVSDTLHLTGELMDGTPIYSEPVGDPGIDQLVKKNK